MGYLVKILPVNPGDIYGYYVGKLDYYSNEDVCVPRHSENVGMAKVYKHRKNAENAIDKILKESTYVSKCEIEEI